MSDTVPLPSTPVTQIWRPSAVRLITLDAAVPTARGTPAQLPLTWPVKDPDDVLDYQFDLADVLNGFGRSYAGDGPCSDSIATLDVSIHPADSGDLALTSAAADGLRCVLWLSGGQAGTTYTVTLRVGTRAGRVLSRSIRLPVLALSSDPTPRDWLLTDDGSTITDQNGQPFFVSQNA